MIINFREKEILGYESPACLEILISLMRGKIDGDKIPKLKLSLENNKYRIPALSSKWKGGHHRVLADILMGEESYVEIIKSNQIIGNQRTYLFPINCMTINSNPRKFIHEKNKMEKFYKDLPTTEEFFGKYQKINMCLKYETHTDYSLTKESYKKILSQLR
jgi:hypothetical protein